MRRLRIRLREAWPMRELLLLLLLMPLSAGAHELPQFTELVEAASPAVVNISTTQKTALAAEGRHGPELPELPPGHPLSDFFNRFRDLPGPAPDEGWDAQSLGSGFIISADGYVLTNYHVVRNADEIVVRLSDRREFYAETLGYDERSDLALLKIDADELPVVRLGRSSELEVGEWVLAIGSPFGFDHSATAGIVSAKGRNLPQENYVPFIQTDVAINPGNSGGPLFNLDGEVVGINSQIYSRTGGFMGLSFAIPIELAMDVAKQLKDTGRVARGWLGVLIQDVDRELAESFGMSRPHGALVAEVVPGSPAEEAGLQVGDVIVSYDGHEVVTSASLPPMVGRSEIDKPITVEVIRDSEPVQLQVEIGELPDEVARKPVEPADVAEGSSARLGLQVDTLSQDHRESLGVDSGVLVTEATGAAEEAGIQPGDVLLMLGQKRLASVEEFARIAAELPPGKAVPILVQREGAPRFLALRVPNE